MRVSTGCVSTSVPVVHLCISLLCRLDKLEELQTDFVVISQTFDGQDGRPKYPRRYVIFPPLL